MYGCAGFTELCQEDQIKLIKQGSFEVVLARYVALFEEDGMYIPSMEMKIPRYSGQSSCRTRRYDRCLPNGRAMGAQH